MDRAPDQINPGLFTQASPCTSDRNSSASTPAQVAPTPLKTSRFHLEAPTSTVSAPVSAPGSTSADPVRPPGSSAQVHIVPLPMPFAQGADQEVATVQLPNIPDRFHNDNQLPPLDRQHNLLERPERTSRDSGIPRSAHMQPSHHQGPGPHQSQGHQQQQQDQHRTPNQPPSQGPPPGNRDASSARSHPSDQFQSFHRQHQPMPNQTPSQHSMMRQDQGRNPLSYMDGVYDPMQHQSLSAGVPPPGPRHGRISDVPYNSAPGFAPQGPISGSPQNMPHLTRSSPPGPPQQQPPEQSMRFSSLGMPPQPGQGPPFYAPSQPGPPGNHPPPEAGGVEGYSVPWTQSSTVQVPPLETSRRDRGGPMGTYSSSVDHQGGRPGVPQHVDHGLGPYQHGRPIHDQQSQGPPQGFSSQPRPQPYGHRQVFSHGPQGHMGMHQQHNAPDPVEPPSGNPMSLSSIPPLQGLNQHPPPSHLVSPASPGGPRRFDSSPYGPHGTLPSASAGGLESMRQGRMPPKMHMGMGQGPSAGVAMANATPLASGSHGGGGRAARGSLAGLRGGMSGAAQPGTGTTRPSSRASRRTQSSNLSALPVHMRNPKKGRARVFRDCASEPCGHENHIRRATCERCGEPLPVGKRRRDSKSITPSPAKHSGSRSTPKSVPVSSRSTGMGTPDNSFSFVPGMRDSGSAGRSVASAPPHLGPQPSPVSSVNMMKWVGTPEQHPGQVGLTHQSSLPQQGSMPHQGPMPPQGPIQQQSGMASQQSLPIPMDGPPMSQTQTQDYGRGGHVHQVGHRGLSVPQSTVDSSGNTLGIQSTHEASSAKDGSDKGGSHATGQQPRNVGMSAMGGGMSQGLQQSLVVSNTSPEDNNSQ